MAITPTHRRGGNVTAAGPTPQRVGRTDGAAPAESEQPPDNVTAQAPRPTPMPDVRTGTTQAGLLVPAGQRTAPTTRPTSATPASPSYNAERQAYAAAVAQTVRDAPCVRRNNAEAVGFAVGAALSLPSDFVGRTVRSLASLGDSALRWNLRALHSGGVGGALTALVLPLTGLAKLGGAILRLVAGLIDAPFAAVRSLCNAVGRGATREQPAPAQDANFARVPADAWPDLPTNRAASARARAYVAAGKLDPYDAIIVPGVTADSDTAPLSSAAAARLDQAAADLRAGKAPLIIVSGGNVHPPGTPYNEAFEMRRYLIEHCHVSADAILVEPLARHTTTNLRDAGRLMQHLGLRRALVATTPTPVIGQSAYLHNADSAFYGFTMRSFLEDGTRFGSLQRIDAAHTAYVPAATVNLVPLHDGAADAADP